MQLHHRRIVSISWAVALAGYSVLCLPAKAADTSTTLDRRIAEIALHPDVSVMGLSSDVRGDRYLPFFGFVRGESSISMEQFIELRKQRDEAVKILRRDIRAMKRPVALVDPITGVAPSVVVHIAGVPLDAPSFAYESRLLMLLDLNASESLEDLIAAAQRL